MESNLNSTILDLSIAAIFGSTYFFGLILEILCAILFIYQILIKRTQYFCTAFFYILTIGFGFDLASIAMIIVGALTKETSNHDDILNIGLLLYWYSMMLLGPWNTLMALNRFTAVWFWKKHELIWNWKLVIAGIIVMFIYPFILSINLLTKDVYCYFHPNDEKSCQEFTTTAMYVGTISNGIHVLLAAILGIVTACASRCSIISVTPETKKFEQFLLIQSLISLILYGFNLLQTLTFTNGVDDTVLKRIVSNLSETYYTFFRISSALLLFFLSKTMRQSFVSFYKLRLIFCCCCKKKVQNRHEGSNIEVVTRTSITMLKIS